MLAVSVSNCLLLYEALYMYNLWVLTFKIIYLFFKSQLPDLLKMLHCHHFNAQHVLRVKDEPVSLCCTGRKVFVATEYCQIEQFDIAAEQCKLVNSFPTVAVVKEMAYCATGLHLLFRL